MSSRKCVISTIIAVVVVSTVIGIASYYVIRATKLMIPSDLPATVLFASTTDGRILQLDPNLGNYTTLVKEDSPIQSFEYYRKNKVLFYGIDKPGEPVKVWGTGYNHLMNYTAPWTKTAMAIDYRTERLYVLDGLAGKLYAIDMNDASYFVYLADLKKPKNLEAAPERDKLFIFQDSTMIVIHTDTRVAELIETDIEALAFDRKTKEIYFASEGPPENPEMGASGDHIIRYVHDRCTSSMTAFDGHLLYIKSKNGTGRSLNKCSEGCKVVETVMLDDEQVSLLSYIKAYDFIVNDFQ